MAPLFVLLCANKCTFGETVGFRVLRINQVACGIGMNRAVRGPGEWLLKGGRRLCASCCWRWPGTAGRTEQCLQHLPGRETSS